MEHPLFPTKLPYNLPSLALALGPRGTRRNAATRSTMRYDGRFTSQRMLPAAIHILASGNARGVVKLGINRSPGQVDCDFQVCFAT